MLNTTRGRTSLILAIAALLLSALAFGYAWRTQAKLNGLAAWVDKAFEAVASDLEELDDALDAVLLQSLPADAILTLEDGEEAELRFDRGH